MLFLLQAFEELLQYVESDSSEVRELFDSMIDGLATVVDANFDTAAQMTFKLLTSKRMDFSAFEQHPLKRVIELHNNSNKKNYCSLLKHLFLLYPLITEIPFTVPVNLAKEPEWQVVLDKFNIPSTVQLGQIGYYFYSKNLLQATVQGGHRCCDSFQTLMLIPSRDGRKEVLNPLVLLLLNNFQSCDPANTLILDRPSDSAVELACRRILNDIAGTQVEQYFIPLSL
jgi:hypothetical protein